jgi:hypothetical protein
LSTNYLEAGAALVAFSLVTVTPMSRFAADRI